MPLPMRILRTTTKRLLRRVTRRFGGIGLSPASLRLEILEDRTLMSAGSTALDAYVAASDSSYTYSLNNTITGSGYTDYVKAGK